MKLIFSRSSLGSCGSFFELRFRLLLCFILFLLLNGCTSTSKPQDTEVESDEKRGGDLQREGIQGEEKQDIGPHVEEEQGIDAHDAVLADSLKPEQVQQAVAGIYSNASQMVSLPPDVATEYNAESRWVDSKYAIFASIDAEQILGETLYLQWHSGDEDGAVSRQRIWSFVPGVESNTVEMHFYTLTETAQKQTLDSHLLPANASALTLDDLITYPPGCEVIWRRSEMGLVGRMNEQCKITAQRSGRTMSLKADMSVSGSRLVYREAGVLEDGSYAFEVPGGQAYIFERVD